jgi:PAS domain S-box-containing protein
MKYNLSEIFDITELQQLCESFTKINGIVTAILDLDGNILVATGWQPVCTQFHRIHNSTRKCCTESDTSIANKLISGEKYTLYKCKNGLVDVAMPIIVGEHHVGNFYTGQFFLEKPDTEFFRNQARKYNFDEANYLSALRKVPVFDEETIKKNVTFLVQLTETIGNFGLKNLLILEQNKLLENERINLKQLNDEYAALNEEYKTQNEELHEAKLIAEASEKKIKEQSHEIESFFSCAIDLLCIGSIDGYFIRLNKEWENTLGYKVEELEGVKLIDYVHPDDLNIVVEGFRTLREYTNMTNTTIRVRCKNGEYKWLEWKSYPYGTKIYAAARDITERKRALEELVKVNAELKVAKEKAEESDRLKSAFLANMSHEIRTPMNAIVGFSEFLLNPGLSDDKKQRFTKIIKERAFDLLRIVEDILVVSKIEVGQIKLIEKDFDLFQMMNDLFIEYEEKIRNAEGKSDIRLLLSLAPEIKNLTIAKDDQRLKQIITNLLDNAIKFIHKGYIEFGCNIEDSSIVFFVKDTGIGIPDEKKEIIFDRFRQADEALTGRAYGGTGLGLAIAKGFVNLMNGKIWVESKVNEGSKFSFSIPLSENQTKKRKVVENTTTVHPLWKNNTILLVEDDTFSKDLMTEVLTSCNLNLLIARNGEEAMQLFHNHPEIGIVLMDIQLPDTNGLILTGMMKKAKPAVVIIAQSAYASPSDIADCRTAGCNDYISKPINKNKLFEIFDKYMSQ